jgi:hypothetical protein
MMSVVFIYPDIHMLKTIQSFFGIFLLSVVSLAPVAMTPAFAEE